MLELYQTEWCPASRRVRERLTELGVDYLARQVPVERGQRVALLTATGYDTIPALILDDGTAIVGEDAIGACLEERFDDPPEAQTHRLKAEKARRRYLEEQCGCSETIDLARAPL
jgi:glutathione S-transferase